MKSRTISSALWMATITVGISYQGILLRAQTKSPPDPYVQMRASAADNVPRITANFISISGGRSR